MKTSVIIEQQSSQFDRTCTVLVELPEGTPDSNAQTLINEVTQSIERACKRIEGFDQAAARNAQVNKLSVQKGRPAKQVYIESINPTIIAPAGVNEQEVYSSARELSQLLGYGYNACLMALSRERGFHRKMATLRGVTFCFVEDMDVSD